MQIHALWCHPRSVSTAFERIMRERGDLDVLHEPFMYHHYLTHPDGLFTGFSPDPAHPRDYAAIRAMILQRSQSGPVFFKDMAYYIGADLPADPDFADAMTHAFLVRDPAESILSYYGREPGFSCREVGLTAQLALYEALRGRGHDPVVLTADQLRADPEATLRRYWQRIGLYFAAHAFCWKKAVPAAWQSVAHWHEKAALSQGIEAAEATRDSRDALARLGAPYTGYESHHRPAYERLLHIAQAQARAAG